MKNSCNHVLQVLEMRLKPLYHKKVRHVTQSRTSNSTLHFKTQLIWWTQNGYEKQKIHHTHNQYHRHLTATWPT
jgi:hypothetical protein